MPFEDIWMVYLHCLLQNLVPRQFPKIQKIIMTELKVPLPWDPQKVISAIGEKKAVKAYVEVYLCPLRTHIGKSPGSKTGELLSLVQKEFFSGIICS
jgi:hypothetical protein